MKNDGNTEKVPALPGDHIEVVEGVFHRSVGKKLPINFRNATGKINGTCVLSENSFLTLHYAGDDLYVITGQKLFFEALHVAKGEIKTIKIKPEIQLVKSKHRFAVSPKGSVD